MVGAFLVHGWTTGIHGLTRLTMAQTWRKPSPSPLKYSLWWIMGGYIRMSFCLGTKLGLPTLWRAIISYENLQLRWIQKKSCSTCWKLSNDMWHATCIHIFQGDSWLLVDESQIGILTHGPSFGHNLCFKYSNGSCEPILDI